MTIHDISRGLLETAPYPGDPAPALSLISSIEAGDDCNLSLLTACVHAATHADSPSHYIAGAAAIEKLPLDRFVGPCRVASGLEFPHERLLLRSGVALRPSDAATLRELGVRTIGVEELSIGGSELHREFLSRGFAVLEGLKLDAVPDGEYFLCAAPILIEGADGAFARALLIEGR